VKGSTPTDIEQSDMGLLSWMQPRDHRAAGRSVSILCAVAVGVTVVFAPFQPGDEPLETGTIVVGAGVLVFITVLSLLARYFREANRLAWALCPLLAVAAIVVIDLLTNDSSVSAQIFFLFPTLYGAWQLRPPGAAVMTGASLVGEIVVVSAQLPARQAVVEAGYVAAALVTTALLLTISSERQARLVARLEQLAAVDPLTGLVTRRVLDEAARSALSGAGSDEGTALILLDVDNFKDINDTHGHPGGDEVLVRLAELLVSRTRRGDVVCRLGGDEIAVLLPACSPADSERRADELLTDVRDSVIALESEEVRVSVSMGLAHAPTHAVDLPSLYSAADTALYRAKQAGRDRVVVATTA
jgi:diguanylate cyclase (GGDEF)-like protein